MAREETLTQLFKFGVLTFDPKSAVVTGPGRRGMPAKIALGPIAARILARLLNARLESYGANDPRCVVSAEDLLTEWPPNANKPATENNVSHQIKTIRKHFRQEFVGEAADYIGTIKWQGYWICPEVERVSALPIPFDFEPGVGGLVGEKVESDFPRMFLRTSVAAAASALVWSITCRALGWQYYFGASGLELHGWHAVVWGIASAFPIISAATLFNWQQFSSQRQKPVAAALFLWVLYAGFGGLAGVLFYDLPWRSGVESSIAGYVLREVLIVIFWSGTISLVTALPLLLMFAVPSVLRLVLVTVAFSLAAVMLSFIFPHDPNTMVLTVRGILAHMALGSGLFVGAFDTTQLPPKPGFVRIPA